MKFLSPFPLSMILLSIGLCVGMISADTLPSAVSAIAADTADTAVPHIDPPDLGRFLDASDSIPRKHNALLAGGLSLLMPGAGQISCRRYVKGGIFLASEALAGTITAQRYWYSRTVERQSELDARTAFRLWADSFAVNTDTVWQAANLATLRAAEASIGLARHDRLAGEFSANQALALTAGIHVFNVLDAVESSRRFHDDLPRKPAVAALLSAVPFLGLGQVYNGTFSRTGLVMMTQGCLAYMAWNNQRLMDNAVSERSRLRVLSLNDPSWSSSVQTWDGRYRDAFTRRNTYLWYFVLFYFYGIADAAIDAQLHDFGGRMRIVPVTGLDAQGKAQVGLDASATF